MVAQIALSLSANAINSWLPSNSPRLRSAPVHAKIVATELGSPFYTLSAVTSGVKEVREVIETAKRQQFFNSATPLLFIDEIHRFNKSQQDSLLGAVEKGEVVLIGATTENPSFEVITPLLSRCQVYTLKSMDDGQHAEHMDVWQDLQNDLGAEHQRAEHGENDHFPDLAGT